MVSLTEKAAKKILEIANKEDMKPVIRAGCKGGGCSGLQYALFFEDEYKDDDEEFESHGAIVLVDPLSLQYIEGTEIDYIEEDLVGVGFRFNNPKTTASCGCGMSFQA